MRPRDAGRTAAEELFTARVALGSKLCEWPHGATSTAAAVQNPRCAGSFRWCRLTALTKARLGVGHVENSSTLLRRRRSGHRRICRNACCDPCSRNRHNTFGWRECQQCVFQCCEQHPVGCLPLEEARKTAAPHVGRPQGNGHEEITDVRTSPRATNGVTF